MSKKDKKYHNRTEGRNDRETGYEEDSFFRRLGKNYGTYVARGAMIATLLGGAIGYGNSKAREMIRDTYGRAEKALVEKYEEKAQKMRQSPSQTTRKGEKAIRKVRNYAGKIKSAIKRGERERPWMEDPPIEEEEYLGEEKGEEEKEEYREKPEKRGVYYWARDITTRKGTWKGAGIGAAFGAALRALTGLVRVPIATYREDRKKRKDERKGGRRVNWIRDYLNNRRREKEETGERYEEERKENILPPTLPKRLEIKEETRARPSPEDPGELENKFTSGNMGLSTLLIGTGLLGMFFSILLSSFKLTGQAISNNNSSLLIPNIALVTVSFLLIACGIKTQKSVKKHL